MPYVLCWYEHRRFTVHLQGWIMGYNAKVEENWDNSKGRPCYCILRHKLRPMDDFEKFIDTVPPA